MRPKTRLDPVIKLEERKEEQRLQELAIAGVRARSAEAALIEAQEKARVDHRRASSALDWQLAEVAHVRALHDVRAAEVEVRTAVQEVVTSQARYTAAHSRAEALRRVAAARVDEILSEQNRAEAKQLDEIGTLNFNRNRAA